MTNKQLATRTSYHETLRPHERGCVNEIRRLREANAMLIKFIEGVIEVCDEVEGDAAKVRSNAKNVLGEVSSSLTIDRVDGSTIARLT